MVNSRLGIARLDDQTRSAIAERWAAPSAAASVLERFLLTPLHIQRRIESLSETAREDLVGLLEATVSTVPLEALRADAAGELEDALLIVTDTSNDPPTATLPDDVAVAALGSLSATPCRLRLLLHWLDAEDLSAVHASVLACVAPARGINLAPRRCDELAGWLAEPSTLAAVIRGLTPAGAARLYELAAAGGAVDGGFRRDMEPETWAELRGHGLVWQTAHDIRMPAESLHALSMLRLQRRVHQACGRWADLEARVQRDNVRSFPPTEVPAETLERILAGLVCEPTLPGVGAASKAIYGPDAPDADVFAGDPSDEDLFVAVAPHLMEMEDAAAFQAGAAVQALELLRLLLHQLLASLPTGTLVARPDLESVVDALGGVARDFLRATGRPYLTDPREPLPSELQAGVEAWLDAGPAKLGWVRRGDGLVELPAGELGQTVSLFPDMAEPVRHRVSSTVRLSATVPRVDTHAAMWLASCRPELSAWVAPLLLHAGDRRHLPSPDPSDLPARDQGLRRQFREFLATTTDPTGLAADKLKDFLLLHCSARSLAEVHNQDLELYLLWWLRVDLRTRSVAAIRRAFTAVESLARWAQDTGVEIGFDANGLRVLEGPLLRTASAEDAFLAHPRRSRPTAPGTQAPDRSHHGAAHVVEVSAGTGMLVLETEPGLELTRFHVAADPRPLALLHRGDVLVGTFVRVGSRWWLTTLEGVHLPQSPIAWAHS
jgi:hypothetical protein